MTTLPLSPQRLEGAPPTTSVDLGPTQAPVASDARRRELAAFLRTRRERVQPRDVGLPPGGRRRTPGLRREEVAQLSGVGVTWYTWLEQGRDINVSAQVVDAIARTLKLDRHEWAHLSTLAGVSTGPTPQQCAALSDSVRLVMKQVTPFPAAVLNDRFDILAYNAAYSTVIVDLDSLPVEEHNIVWLAYTHEPLRARLVDVDRACCRLVASFRSAMANHLGDRAWQDLVDRLCRRSPEFAAQWQRHDVAPMGQRVKMFDHPEVGLLRLESSNLWVDQGGSRRLQVYTPMDDDSARKLQQLSD